MSDQFSSPAERLVAALAGDILEGQLESGARLPAHRDLADFLAIGVGTVTKAYSILERRGLVSTVRGRGTFVAAIKPRHGRVFDLSRNVPPAALTERLLARTLTAVAKRIDPVFFHDYPPLGGHAEHRRLLASWFASFGMDSDPDRLLLTNGAHHALSLAFAVACGNGGTLVTEEQTYPGALALARHHGLKVVGIGMDDEGMLPDALDQALQVLGSAGTALYVTPTMHNPTTATMGIERRQAIVTLCRRHDIPIVEDDVYNLGVDRELVPLAMLAPERTFYTNSISKSLTPALRIGGLLVPPSALSQAESLYKAMSIIVSPLSCAVMEQWLIDGTAHAVSQAIQHESAGRVRLVNSMLEGRPRALRYPGYHVWLPMAWQEAERLYETAATFGIRLTPPAATAVTPGIGPSGIRLCIGSATVPDLTWALNAMARIGNTLADGSADRSLLF